MGELKQVMYGVMDFPRMRAANAYFVDRTDLIRYAHRFGELFGGLKIAVNPTDERGKYLALIFNFSGVDKRLNRVQESFDKHCRLVNDQFARHYAVRLPEGVGETVLAAQSCGAKLNALYTGLKGLDVRTDYAKIRQVITESRRLNGSYHKLEDIIAREWNLKAIPKVTEGVPGGTVELCRLQIVFHGGQVVVCEEV